MPARGVAASLEALSKRRAEMGTGLHGARLPSKNSKRSESSKPPTDRPGSSPPVFGGGAPHAPRFANEPCETEFTVGNTEGIYM